MSKSTTPQVTHTTVTLPGTRQDGGPSIRQIIRGGLLAGETTKEIAAKVQAAFPDSAAAKKSAKHIAWYKATMKKAGELPKPE